MIGILVRDTIEQARPVAHVRGELIDAIEKAKCRKRIMDIHTYVMGGMKFTISRSKFAVNDDLYYIQPDIIMTEPCGIMVHLDLERGFKKPATAAKSIDRCLAESIKRARDQIDSIMEKERICLKELPGKKAKLVFK